MVTIERANVVLEIEEEDVDFYLNKGYSLVENGKVIKAAVPVDLGELQRYYVDSQAKFKEYEDTIKTLKAENAKLAKKAQKAN